MTADSQQDKKNISSNLNAEKDQHRPSGDVERLMAGPSIFDEADDDYLEPGEIAEQDEMDAMMAQYLDQMPGMVNQGQLMTVPVVAVKSDHVLVDVGEKSEGIIDIREFPHIDGKPNVKVGDMIDAVVKGPDHESGLINLSHQEARRRRALKEVEDALRDKTVLKGQVIRTVKGGLIIDIGTTAFLPASQIDLRRIDDFEEWVGREVEGYVIEYTPEKRRIILSRRRLLEEQREAQRSQAMEKLTLNETIEASVKRVVEFGAFLDLGGIDGLVPRSEISWNRNAKPDDYLKVGDIIKTKIIEIDQDNGKITLSRRQAMTDPWESAIGKYAVASKVTGQVVSITNYGAFVRIEEGLDGMIHVSDMAWDSAGKRPGEFVQVGQEVSAQVLSIDSQARRISLGLKQMTDDPWQGIEAKYAKGTRIKGQVTGLTKYGAFVELEAGVEGMVHVSDFSWDKRIAQPRDVVKKGDEIEACVLEMDLERRRISLGVKQLTESPVESFRSGNTVGKIVEGEVINLTEFGAFVKLTEGVEGFLHVSQLGGERVNNPADVLKIGENIQAKITKIDPETGKISLSRRQMIRDEERKTVSHYMRKNTSGSLFNMGELLEDIILDDEPPVEKKADAPETPAQPAPEAPAADQDEPRAPELS